MNKREKNPEQNSLNIYQKLQLIQSEIKELIRTEENKGQRYFFFNELQVLQLLKPLLDKHKLVILLSDDENKGFTYEKPGNMYLVQYWKKIEIFNTEQPEEKLTYYFAAIGQNNDPAKAKGSAETYAAKYFLTKLFLIPVKDEGDPDYQPRKIEDSKSDNKNSESEIVCPTINRHQIETLISLFRQKTDNKKELQTSFLAELDNIMNKLGIGGTTNNSNFRTRLNSLTLLDYQYLYNWLVELEEK